MGPHDRKIGGVASRGLHADKHLEYLQPELLKIRHEPTKNRLEMIKERIIKWKA